MSLAFMPPRQRGKSVPDQATIQKMLDENNQLIQTICEYQNKGRASEATQYQQVLHRNLVYLATIADSNQGMQQLLPAPNQGNVPPNQQYPNSMPGGREGSNPSMPPGPGGPMGMNGGPAAGPGGNNSSGGGGSAGAGGGTSGGVPPSSSGPTPPAGRTPVSSQSPAPSSAPQQGGATLMQTPPPQQMANGPMQAPPVTSASMNSPQMQVPSSRNDHVATSHPVSGSSNPVSSSENFLSANSSGSTSGETSSTAGGGSNVSTTSYSSSSSSGYHTASNTMTRHQSQGRMQS